PRKRSRGSIAQPDRLFAQGCDESAVRFAIGFADAGNKRRRPLAHDNSGAAGFTAMLDPFAEAELSLPAADQLEIDFGQNFSVEQRAVFGAARIVDAVMFAQGVEVVWSRRELAARQHQRIDQTIARDQSALDALELGTQKAVVESSIVDHQRRIADESEEFVRDLHEAWLVTQEFDRQPVDGEGFPRHVALRVDVIVERRAGRNPIEQLDTADLDQAMALRRIEAGGFGVENDFAHLISSSFRDTSK